MCKPMPDHRCSLPIKTHVDACRVMPRALVSCPAAYRGQQHIPATHLHHTPTFVLPHNHTAPTLYCHHLYCHPYCHLYRHMYHHMYRCRRAAHVSCTWCTGTTLTRARRLPWCPCHWVWTAWSRATHWAATRGSTCSSRVGGGWWLQIIGWCVQTVLFQMCCV